MLSAWGRALREPLALIYTEKRLSNGLKSRRLDDGRMRSAMLELSAGLVKEHCSAVSVDSTDISKKYAPKMPYIASVYDGSTGEIAKGWTLLRADGVAKNGRHVPLHIETFSRETADYRDDNTQVRGFLEALLRHVPVTTPFVLDSGHDGRSHRQIFEELKLRVTTRLFVGQQHGLRKMDLGSQVVRLADLVSSTASVFRFRVERFTEHAKRPWVVSVGWRSSVRFLDTRDVPEKPKYSIVVVRRPRATPMVLLTTDHVQTEAQARAVAERYFSRWAVEDGHRLLKERFNLENVRALTWRGLKRLVFLAHAAYLFMAWLVYRGSGEELARNAPAFAAVPKLPYYRISIALVAVLAIAEA